jgi:hypothetical protein
VADVPPKGAALGLLAVFGLIAVSAAFVLGMFAIFGATGAPRPVTPLQAARQVPPAPRLQVAPERQLATIRAAEQARLQGYGWADRPAGLARIPIGRAMQLQAGRGWADPPAETRP